MARSGGVIGGDERGMRPAMAVSGIGHLGLIALAVIGIGAPTAPDTPIAFSDVSVVSEADFFTAVAIAPVEAPEVNDGLTAPQTVNPAAVTPDAADPAVQTAEAEALGPTGPAAQDPAERPAAVAVPPLRPREAPAPATRPATPTIVTEAAPAPAAATPDTRPATEPVQPLASTPATPPLGIAEAPPLPEQEPEVAEEERPEAETAVETEVETGAETEVAEVAPETSTVPRARPRPPEPEPTRTAEAAKPEPEAEEKQDDDVLAALNAANASIESVDKAKGETKKKSAASAASTQRAATAPTRAAQFSRGEKDGLSIAVRDEFVYNGRRDGNPVVIVAVSISASGQIVDGPRKVSGSGADNGTLDVLFQSGRRALLKAERKGAFRPLGPKLATYNTIEFRFTPNPGQSGLNS
ncbi:MAG: hypothetical protein AAFW01_05425 [Pseudomonadota bacterium]